MTTLPSDVRQKIEERLKAGPAPNVCLPRADVRLMLDCIDAMENRLVESTDLAREMIGYVPEYFREKWGFDSTLAVLESAQKEEP